MLWIIIDININLLLPWPLGRPSPVLHRTLPIALLLGSRRSTSIWGFAGEKPTISLALGALLFER